MKIPASLTPAGNLASISLGEILMKHLVSAKHSRFSD